MKRSSNRYRSYREKKSQSKVFRSYFLRILIIFILFSIFTSFIAISTKVETDSMSPNLSKGNSIIFRPSGNLSFFMGNSVNRGLERGDLVITGTTYSKKLTIVQRLLDPLVRIFTLQKKSIIYNNSELRGNSELLRVVGLPGDTVRIKDYTVYIKPKSDDFFLSEFELSDTDYDVLKPELPLEWKDEYPFSKMYGEVYIKENQLFLISDNRAVLNDSRVFGPVDYSLIKGRVLFKYWPVTEFSVY